MARESHSLMMMRRLIVHLGLLLTLALRAGGQDRALEPFARVREGDATVALFFPGDKERRTPRPNLPAPAGTELRTGGGRIEIDLPTGATLRIAPVSEVELRAREPGSGEMRDIYLRRGRLSLDTWATEAPAMPVHMEFGRLQPQVPSHLAISKVGDTAVLDVKEGVVEVSGESYATLLSAPGRLVLRHGTPVFAPPVASGEPGRLRDDFTAWVDERRAERTRADGALPDSLWASYAEELSRAGEFITLEGGALGFRPEAGFRPLQDGSFIERPAGRAWVPNDPWAWVTSHYGSWFENASGWIWVPGTEFTLEPVTRRDAPKGPSDHPLKVWLSKRRPGPR